MIVWDDVLDHIEAIHERPSEVGNEIIALAELCMEYENGGITQYLLNSSADSFANVKKAFLRAEFLMGLDWIASVEKAYGSTLSPDRDSRIEAISVMPGFDDGIDPFDAQHEAFTKLFPRVQQIAIALFQVWKSGDGE